MNSGMRREEDRGSSPDWDSGSRIDLIEAFLGEVVERPLSES
jgi:hypothetical protein